LPLFHTFFKRKNNNILKRIEEEEILEY
jgi:hypothetical protein